jgi:biotin transport system substrate-specific component
MSVPREQTQTRIFSATEGHILAQLLWILGFAVLTALGARLEIEHYPVPFTLQTLIVLLSGAFLGPRNGAISQLAYLAAGAMGAPVFAGGAFGILKFLGPTGGYLIAFPVAAALVGWILRDGRSYARVLGAMAAGLIAIFTCGTLHLYAFYVRDLGTAISSGFLIFSWWDLLKLGAATAIYAELGKRWPRLPA